MILIENDDMREAAWECIQRVIADHEEEVTEEQEVKDRKGKTKTVNVKRTVKTKERPDDGIWQLDFAYGEDRGTVGIKHRVALELIRVYPDPLEAMCQMIERTLSK